MSSIMRWRRGLVVAIGASCPERGGCDHHILSDGRFHRSDLSAAPKEQVRSIPGRIESEFAGSKAETPSVRIDEILGPATASDVVLLSWVSLFQVSISR